MSDRLATRSRVAEGVLLFLVLGAGLGLGLVLRDAFGTGAAPAAAPAAHDLVHADPRSLVTQAQDLPSQYLIQGDPSAPDPGSTHPKQSYLVTISRSDVVAYAAQSAVSLYATAADARAALQTLLGLGQFGSELPMHESLGDEAHLFAAKAGDRSLVVGSLLWRDRNVIGYVFVYNPFPAGVPPDAVERLARANAYDDTVGIAIPVLQRVKAAT
ncbi:MAG: hypothetical protein ABI838_07055 [Chloroflexota bacterium]